MKRQAKAAALWGVNWFEWRIIMSPQIPDGATQVQNWHLPRLLEAHAALDAIEAIHQYHRDNPQKP